jgi:hypothetical protein
MIPPLDTHGSSKDRHDERAHWIHSFIVGCIVGHFRVI